jgi:predicted dehydrogenase
VDLLRFVHDTPTDVSGVVRNSVFSRGVDDEVYCTFRFRDGSSGQLAVNWSDESQRKMSTIVSLWGENGRLVADRQECRTYLRARSPELPEYGEGWTIRNTTELTGPVWYYLRGEEYSAQIDHFARNVRTGVVNGENSFASALETDRVIARIHAGGEASYTPAKPRAGWWARLFGRSEA